MIPAFARSLYLRTTPSGRRRLALERAALHSGATRPGLTHLSERGVCRSSGIDVHYYISGPDSQEPARATVVFIHGFTLAAEAYYLQAEYLREHHPDVRSLLIDLRGHGLTGPVDPALCTVDGLGDDTMAVIAEVAPEGPLILVGHSLGGLAAFNVIRRAPEELYRRIAGVMVIATSIEALSAQGIPQVLALPAADGVHAAVAASPKEAQAIREAAASLLAPGLAIGVFTKPTDHRIIEFHAAMINETPLETFVGFFHELQNHDELAARDRLAPLPGFVIVGEKDEVTPGEQADRIQEVWPKAWRQVARSSGHMVILESPEVVNKALDRLLDEL